MMYMLQAMDKEGK